MRLTSVGLARGSGLIRFLCSRGFEGRGLDRVSVRALARFVCVRLGPDAAPVLAAHLLRKRRTRGEAAEMPLDRFVDRGIQFSAAGTLAAEHTTYVSAVDTEIVTPVAQRDTGELESRLEPLLARWTAVG